LVMIQPWRGREEMNGLREIGQEEEKKRIDE
jgi:hypothetical protein